MRDLCADFRAELAEFNGEFPDLQQHYWPTRRPWSGSYFAGSAGGAPISVLRQCIEQQDGPS